MKNGSHFGVAVVALAFASCNSGATDAPRPRSDGICASGTSTGTTTVDECISAACCREFDACKTDPSCFPCITGGGVDCDLNVLVQNFWSCANNTGCMGGGGTGGAGGTGEPQDSGVSDSGGSGDAELPACVTYEGSGTAVEWIGTPTAPGPCEPIFMGGSVADPACPTICGLPPYYYYCTDDSGASIPPAVEGCWEVRRTLNGELGDTLYCCSDAKCFRNYSDYYCEYHYPQNPLSWNCTGDAMPPGTCHDILASMPDSKAYSFCCSE